MDEVTTTKDRGHASPQPHDEEGDDGKKEQLRRCLFEDTPLPPHWTVETSTNPQGTTTIVYYNTITQERTSTHPAEVYYQAKLSRGGDARSAAGSHQSRRGPATEGDKDHLHHTTGSWDQQSEGTGLSVFPGYEGVPVAPRSLHETPIPPCLSFTSWWYEETVSNGMLRKHLETRYDVRSMEFTLRFKGSQDAVCLSHVMGKYGIVDEFDLHVGLTLKLLGRNIVLKQADGTTVLWLESEHRRLRAVRDRLARELCKYDVQYRKLQDVYHKDDQLTCGTRQSLANTALRGTKMEVKGLYDHLERIRPKLAQRLRQQLGS